MEQREPLAHPAIAFGKSFKNAQPYISFTRCLNLEGGNPPSVAEHSASASLLIHLMVSFVGEVKENLAETQSPKKGGYKSPSSSPGAFGG